MLTVHHLGKSQSERIVWLCEELAIPYELVIHDRDAVTMLSPPSLRALHPIGSAPVIEDGDIVLAESGAIVDYILARYGGGKLRPAPESADFPAYLYWFHFANGTLQLSMMRGMTVHRLNLPADNPVRVGADGRLARHLAHVDARVAAVPWFAGEKFSAADIMMVFSLTTMRYFYPVDLSPYPNILAYLQRVGAREGFRRAMAKGDPKMVPLLT